MRIKIFRRIWIKIFHERAWIISIVLAVQHFRSYIHGESFRVVSDHNAVEKALKSNLAVTMLAVVEEVWWPQIHRQFVALAKNCSQCQKAGKSFKVLERQKQFGKLKKSSQSNEEKDCDFMGPLSNAPEGRQYVLVAIDHFSGCPTLKFVRNTSIRKLSVITICRLSLIQ